MSVGHDQKYLKPIYQILRLRGKVIMEEKVQCNEVEGGKIFLPEGGTLSHADQQRSA